MFTKLTHFHVSVITTGTKNDEFESSFFFHQLKSPVQAVLKKEAFKKKKKNTKKNPEKIVVAKYDQDKKKMLKYTR